MIKQWKLVIGAGSAVAVLGVALLLVIKFVPQVNENPVPDYVPPAEGYNILNLQNSDLKSIDFKSKDGGFRVLFDSTNEPYIENPDNLPVSSSALSTLVFNATQLYRIKEVIQNPTDLSAYGLADPQATFTITQKDGTKLVFDVGDMSPMENYYYGYDHRTNWVYTFSSSFERLGKVCLRRYIETNLSPSVGEDEMSKVGMFRVRTPSTNNEVVEIRRKTTAELAENSLNNSEFVFDKPQGMAEPSDGYLGLNVLPCFEQVKAEEAYIMHPTKADIAKLGLDAEHAYYDLYFTVDGKGYQFYYSKPDTNNNMYVRTPSIDCIYSITTYNTTVLRSSISDMQSSLVYIEYLDNLKSITVDQGGKTYTFGISGSTSTEATDKLKVTYGGKVVDSTEFSKLYQIMLGITVSGQTTDTPPSDADTIKITYSYRDSSKKDVVITYRSIDGRRYQVEYNSVTKFYTLKKQIDALTTNLTNFLNGKTVEDIYESSSTTSTTTGN